MAAVNDASHADLNPRVLAGAIPSLKGSKTMAGSKCAPGADNSMQDRSKTTAKFARKAASQGHAKTPLKKGARDPRTTSASGTYK